MQGNYKIINGNSYEELKKFPDNYFDSVVTDPPYGLGKEPDATDMLKAWVETGYMEVKGSGFMGKEWDAFVPQPLFWKEVFRVLKHGGHVVAFYGTRTYDWGVMAMRLAGFEIRDGLQWVYGSGFPKSYNVGKGIEGKIILGNSNPSEFKNLKGDVSKQNLGLANADLISGHKIKVYDKTKINVDYQSEQGKQWDGWGSALKPAVEPIVLARKPLEKGLSIAENVLKWGVGAINIDASRISTNDNYSYPNGAGGNGFHGGVGRLPDGSRNDTPEMNVNGRFPANLLMSHHPDCEFKGMKKVKGQIDKPTNRTQFDGTWNESNTGFRNNTNLSKEGYGDENGEETIENWNCHEDCPIKIMDGQSGTLNKQGISKSDDKSGWQNNYVGGGGVNSVKRKLYLDEGGASRFFYVAKASKSERNFGLSDFDDKPLAFSNQAKAELKRGNVNFTGNDKTGDGNLFHGNSIRHIKNNHPTVKPVKLMQYLARLITPPNGRILDPFNGSGTTGVASVLEGFEYVGIELDKEFCNISEARISAWDEIDEYEQYKKIIESQEEEKENENYGKQINMFEDLF